MLRGWLGGSEPRVDPGGEPSAEPGAESREGLESFIKSEAVKQAAMVSTSFQKV